MLCSCAPLLLCLPLLRHVSILSVGMDGIRGGGMSSGGGDLSMTLLVVGTRTTSKSLISYAPQSLNTTYITFITAQSDSLRPDVTKCVQQVDKVTFSLNRPQPTPRSYSQGIFEWHSHNNTS
jgi:hypothetical protein